MKKYLKRERLENSPKGKYRYRYLVECCDCKETRWTKSYPKDEFNRCQSCAGSHGYTPAKVTRSNIRKRGDGYITKQGYHLIFDGEKYIPAHRYAFPDLPSDMVVHHIDGNKLNNVIENLVPLTKKDHREAHGSLEQQSYQLIQAGLIEYDRDTNSYNLSSSMKKFIELISENSVEPLTDDAEGNTEPSQHIVGRCNDYPVEEYARSLVEARNN